MQVKTEEDEENEAPYLYRCPICLSSGETGLVYDEGVDAEGEPESILRGLVPAVELQGGIVEWGLPCNHRTCLPCATRWMRERNQTTLPCPVCRAANSMPLDPANFLSRALMIPVAPQEEIVEVQVEIPVQPQRRGIEVLPSAFRWNRENFPQINPERFNILMNISSNLLVFGEERFQIRAQGITRQTDLMSKQAGLGKTVILESIGRFFSDNEMQLLETTVRFTKIDGMLTWLIQNWQYQPILKEIIECEIANMIVFSLESEERTVVEMQFRINQIFSLIRYSFKFWVWPKAMSRGHQWTETIPTSELRFLRQLYAFTHDIPSGFELLDAMGRDGFDKYVCTIFSDRLFAMGHRFASRPDIVDPVWPIRMDWFRLVRL